MENKENNQEVQEQEVAQETPVVALNPNLPESHEAVSEQPEQPEQSLKDIVITLLEDLCIKHNIQMHDIANSLAVSLQRQIGLAQKERDYFRKTKESHNAKVEYKELLAREIKADQVINGHKKEIDSYLNSIVQSVMENLQLTESKDITEKVANIFKMKYSDIKTANDNAIIAKAKELAESMKQQ